MVPLAYEINKIVHIHLYYYFFILALTWPEKWSTFVFFVEILLKKYLPKNKIIRFKLIEFILPRTLNL